MALALMWPGTAAAQRRGPVRGPVVRSSVIVVGGYRYAPYRFYDPWYQWGPYPYPYPPYGYRYAYRDDLTSSLKLEVSPKQAEVFVDGYRAGVVDDFDGMFQRLRLRPGGHELVLFLQGYRTIRQTLYLNPGSDQKIRYTLDRLGVGEASEPPPPSTGQPVPMGPPQTGAPQPQGPQAPPPPPTQNGNFGTLSIRVQPGDADILIDGERWNAPAGEDRLSVRLNEGRHHVEVRKTGFNPYVEDVLVRRGSTLPLNVSLLRGNSE